MSGDPKAGKERILLISPGPKFNLEYSFFDRCSGLSKQYEGVILTSGPERKRCTFGDFEVICVGDAKGHSLFTFIWFIFKGLRLVLGGSFLRGERRFKLIGTYDPLKTGLVAFFLGLCSRIPYVVEVNGDYTSDALYVDIDSKLKRQARKWLLCKIEKLVLDHSSGVKLLYDSQIDYFLPLLNNAVITRFPDYVNTTNMENKGEEKQILFIGFPYYVKGVDILIKAFKSLSDQFPEWSLKILGYFPDMEELECAIDNHPQISYHPPVDPADIPEHIGRCGIFVLPSRTEAMGRVLIEAMASGKPRVGSNVGGIPTVITHNVDGFLFSPGDEADLASKLEILMADEAMRRRQGDAGLERYKIEFGNEQYFKRLSNFYQSVISCSS
ncbi:glycosyl transferase group 1 [Marinobacter nitratireducens]|uniref:Glycosyl transferase group 1 n=1 Tax=Marinobacter nitratireducens TaxID=1137280 RepID=A0A072N3Z3_9GAMM|nr:glycosyltransferase family 4 protein [Marinobacter nitratireducens]KEF32231.1 glycosyl transferase group 1 [Marinobacter nitratireducens]